MHRRWLVVVSLLVSAACGGGGSPTTPTPTETRVIFLEGSLAFGDVPIGGTAQRDLRIFNQGSAPLTVTGLTGPSGFTASWTSGTIPGGNGRQDVVVRFTPTEGKSYNGTLTVNGNQTSGTNTLAITARGLRDLFTRSGTGNTVFDMPTDVARVRIIATYTQNSSNFIVRIGGRLIVNELVGTFWSQTRYDGTHLTNGGGVVEITNSSGVAWSFEEQR